MLDSGDGVTHAVPVYEGFSMPHAVRRVDVAGRDVTEHLQLLLRKAGYHFQTSAEKEVVRMIKEKACYVALNPAKEEKESGGRGEDFKLPDGNTLRVRAQVINCQFTDILAIQLGPERFRAPEILFNPELVGQEYAGVHQVIVDSINKADLDLRKSLFSNVILSGGSTLTKGMLCPKPLCCLAEAMPTRLRRSPLERDQETRTEGDQNQDLCTTRAQILDMDR